MALTDPQGSIQACLPMIRSKRPCRHKWSSLPFTDTLEPVAVDKTHRDRLLAAAAEHTRTRPIVLRSRAELPGWFSCQVGTVQVIDLTGGAEGVLRRATAHHRRSVKRAHRTEARLSVRPITTRTEFLGANTALVARSRRRLGAPTQPRRYWARLWELHERGEALTIGVYADRALAANGVFILGREHAVYKYGASDAASRHLRTSFLMFATAFDELADRGMRSLDLGITDLRNTTLREFKARWGGEEQPAHYSATSVRLLPNTLEPGLILAKTIRRMPVFVGRTVGSIAYPFVV
jgi:Acetyltransferase (GNAT) domain